MLAVGMDGSAVFVVGAEGCAAAWAEESVLDNVKSAALAFGLGVCAGSWRGFCVGQRQGSGVGSRARQVCGVLA